MRVTEVTVGSLWGHEREEPIPGTHCWSQHKVDEEHPVGTQWAPSEHPVGTQ